MEMNKKTIIIAAVVTLLSVNTALNAYASYAALWQHPEIKNSTIRLMGDSNNNNYREAEAHMVSRKNIDKALEKTKFKPFWVAERFYNVNPKLSFGQIPPLFGYDVKSMTLPHKLMYVHHVKKNDYKKKVMTLKKEPNLFSKKSFMWPKDGVLQNLSPIRTDEEKAYFEIEDFFDAVQGLSISRSNDVSNKKNLLQDIQEELKRIKYSALDFTKLILESAGNQFLACELVLKLAKNDVLLNVLKDLYNSLVKNIAITKDSAVAKFMAGESIDNLDQDELEEKLGNFIKSLRHDLPRFNNFAQTVKFSYLTNNAIFHASTKGVYDMQNLLEQAGYKCIWSKQAEKDQSLSVKDCEEFFKLSSQSTAQPSYIPKQESFWKFLFNTDDGVAIKSKL